jgi:hypothetical protein
MSYWEMVVHITHIIHTICVRVVKGERLDGNVFPVQFTLFDRGQHYQWLHLEHFPQSWICSPLRAALSYI